MTALGRTFEDVGDTAVDAVALVEELSERPEFGDLDRLVGWLVRDPREGQLRVRQRRRGAQQVALGVVDAESTGERPKVAEVLSRWMERVHEQHRPACAEPLGFENGRACAVKQLVPKLAGSRRVEAEQPAELLEPFVLAFAAVGDPIDDELSERLVDLALNGNRRELAIAGAREHEEICLTGPRTAGQRDAMLRQTDQRLESAQRGVARAAQDLLHGRREASRELPRAGQLIRGRPRFPVLDGRDVTLPVLERCRREAEPHR